MARGRGMSRYHGLRVSVTQVAGSDLAHVQVRAKGANDGWDEWRHLVAQEQIFTAPMGSTTGALVAVRDYLSALIAERAQMELWEDEE